MRGLPVVLLVVATLAGCVDTPPSGLECDATEKGILLTWDAHPNATSYRIYRTAGESFPEQIANVTETEYLDEDVEGGEDYTYFVTAWTEKGESAHTSCDVRAIPYFPGVLVGALAVVGGVAAYVAWKRRG